MSKVEFGFKDIGDIHLGRQNLGGEMPVSVYRMFVFGIRKVLEDRYGPTVAEDILRETGEQAGQAFAKEFLDMTLNLSDFIAHLQSILKEQKIGIIRVESFDEATGRIVFTVAEDLDCSGLPVTGKAVCNYDEGFIQGIISLYTHKVYTVIETDCWATGARTCRFEAKVKN